MDKKFDLRMAEDFRSGLPRGCWPLPRASYKKNPGILLGFTAKDSRSSVSEAHVLNFAPWDSNAGGI